MKKRPKNGRFVERVEETWDNRGVKKTSREFVRFQVNLVNVIRIEVSLSLHVTLIRVPFFFSAIKDKFYTQFPFANDKDT